jgi:hypothetical protein
MWRWSTPHNRGITEAGDHTKEVGNEPCISRAGAAQAAPETFLIFHCGDGTEFVATFFEARRSAQVQLDGKRSHGSPLTSAIWQPTYGSSCKQASHASGVLIVLGPGARWSVAIGTMVATIWANLLGDRNVGIAVVSALCNAGEALLIAWLIERAFGPNFALDSLGRVLGMMAATLVGTTVSGIGGTAGFVYFHSSATPVLTIWQHWFASDALGVVAIAPGAARR